MRYKFHIAPDPKPVTLPRLRCLEGVERPPGKVVGGDLYRARAPKPVDDPEPRYAYDESALTMKRPGKARTPAAMVPKYPWTEQTTALARAMVDAGATSETVADYLNQHHPYPNVKVTKNSVLGRMHRLRSCKTTAT